MVIEAIRQRPAFRERPEHVFYGGSLEQTRQMLEQMLAPNDVALLIGFGNDL
jgi:hypothetical protein